MPSLRFLAERAYHVGNAACRRGGVLSAESSSVGPSETMSLGARNDSVAQGERFYFDLGTVRVESNSSKWEWHQWLHNPLTQTDINSCIMHAICRLTTVRSCSVARMPKSARSRLTQTSHERSEIMVDVLDIKYDEHFAASNESGSASPASELGNQ